MATTPCTSEFEAEIGELLDEFEAVVEELSAPSVKTHGTYEPLLTAAKQRPSSGDGVADSGIEDTDEGSEASRGNSLNASVEELNTACMMPALKAKLGDTSDLQSFIENLDKELAEM
ncbi:regulator of cell cycle RGCC-like [Trichomycterus rosablanca]|uniref:regulator of cell cycle RGCC-like n=1 Tax=Trichomycterus rosablanca TaxID=2290929 RepID=UPI002F35CDDD